MIGGDFLRLRVEDREEGLGKGYFCHLEGIGTESRGKELSYLVSKGLLSHSKPRPLEFVGLEW